MGEQAAAATGVGGQVSLGPQALLPGRAGDSNRVPFSGRDLSHHLRLAARVRNPEPTDDARRHLGAGDGAEAARVSQEHRQDPPLISQGPEGHQRRPALRGRLLPG